MQGWKVYEVAVFRPWSHCVSKVANMYCGNSTNKDFTVSIQVLDMIPHRYLAYFKVSRHHRLWEAKIKA